MMGLNKSLIEWCDYTANPVRGKCFHDCHYCYMTAQHKRFKTGEEVTFHPEVLGNMQDYKKAATIFVGSSHDIFGAWVKEEWLTKILNNFVTTNKRRIYLTKNPERLPPRPPIICPSEFFGASIDTVERALVTNQFRDRLDFLSIEPLLKDVSDYVDLRGIGAVIIGAQTGRGAFKPPVEWVQKLIARADANDAKVFIKDNLLKLYPELPRRRELLWPLFTKDAK